MTNDKESDSSSVDDLLRMTVRLFRIGTESPPRFSPGPAAGVALSARAGPGARSSVSEREQILRDMLAIIVNFAF